MIDMKTGKKGTQQLRVDAMCCEGVKVCGWCGVKDAYCRCDMRGQKG